MKLDKLKLPTHIAYIIDGNGRWAKHRGMPRMFGHKVGFETLRKMVTATFDMGIKVMSVYGFSTENWNRPQDELNGLFDIFSRFFDEDLEKLNERRVKVRVMGDYTKFPESVVNNLNNIIEKTKDNDKFVLNLGLNYGSHDEIVRGVNNLIKEGKTEVTKEDIENSLYTANLPPLDFCIRTSGEQRLSNFMLWQMAYTELYFPKVYWPAFNKRHLVKALKIFARRNRRFGAIKEEKKVEIHEEKIDN